MTVTLGVRSRASLRLCCVSSHQAANLSERISNTELKLVAAKPGEAHRLQDVLKTLIQWQQVLRWLITVQTPPPPPVPLGFTLGALGTQPARFLMGRMDRPRLRCGMWSELLIVDRLQLV